MNQPHPDIKRGLLPNGDVRVEYFIGRTAVMVDLVEEHFEAVYEQMKNESTSERTCILRSVREAIRIACKARNPTDEQKQNLCDDVAIWFAGEVLAGRAPHPWQTVTVMRTAERGP